MPLHSKILSSASNMFNHLAVNPGYAGSQGMLSVGMINRQQWMGFRKSKTTLFSVHTPVKPLESSAGLALLLWTTGSDLRKTCPLP